MIRGRGLDLEIEEGDRDPAATAPGDTLAVGAGAVLVAEADLEWTVLWFLPSGSFGIDSLHHCRSLFLKKIELTKCVF
jgi:hypothetical protein